MPPRLAELASVLASAAPDIRTSLQLATQIWGAAKAEQKEPGIRAHVRELRLVLAPLGYGVDNSWGGGYWLATLEAIAKRHALRPRRRRPFRR